MEQIQFENKLHRLTAGLLPEDNSIELFGQLKTRKVFFLQNGKTSYFEKLPNKIKNQIKKRLLADKKARADLSGMNWKDALEEYAFCLFGTADGIADFPATGDGQTGENFRCGKSCRCLKWDSKKISYKGTALTPRELEVLDKMKSGDPDKVIAGDLGIAMPTLNSHKQNIMTKLGAQSKAQVIFNAAQSGIFN